MDDWDQFQHQMDLDIPETLDLNEICKKWLLKCENSLLLT